MKQLFFFALPALLVSTPALAIVDPEIHRLCMEANDYSGCVNINNELESKKVPPKQVIDFLQDELYEGWTSYAAPFGKSITFIKPKTTEKLMVRSTFGRYFQFSYVQRDYVPPVSPTDGYYGAMEPERTTCEWKQKKSVCTTYPATRRWHPGKPGQLETFNEESSLAIVDCKDKTAKWSKANRSWRTTLPYFVKRSIKDFCQRIDTLSPSENKKYASGAPTSEELRFIDKNRAYNRLESDD